MHAFGNVLHVSDLASWLSRSHTTPPALIVQNPMRSVCSCPRDHACSCQQCRHMGCRVSARQCNQPSTRAAPGGGGAGHGGFLAECAPLRLRAARGVRVNTPSARVLRLTAYAAEARVPTAQGGVRGGGVHGPELALQRRQHRFVHIHGCGCGSPPPCELYWFTLVR